MQGYSADRRSNHHTGAVHSTLAPGYRPGQAGEVHACLYGILSDAMEDDFVFRRHDSQDPMTPSTFTWRFKMILKKNSLPEKLNVHSLRHSNASLLIAGGADVATVAGLLGHSQPSTTLDIYTHAFDKNKKAASEALQRGLDI